jgi:hypothetical protein
MMNSAAVLTMPETAEQADLVKAIEKSSTALTELLAAIRSRVNAWWAWPDKVGEATPPSLDHLVDGMRTVNYKKNQDSVDSIIVPGVICVPASTCKLALELNRSREELHACAVAMGNRLKKTRNQNQGRVEYLTLFRFALRDAGEAHLNFWQASRKLCVLENAPHLISYVWYRPYEFKTYTIDEVRALLGTVSASTAPHIATDLVALKKAEKGQLFARRLDRPAHPRVNVATMVGGELKRSVVRGSLPLIVCGTEMPELRPLPKDRTGSARTREGVVFGEEIVIKHLGLHLYHGSAKPRRRKIVTMPA